MTAARSWLCPTAGDRERFLDMQQRLKPARIATIVGGQAIAIVMAIRFGWAVPIANLAMVAIVLVGSARLDRRRRPELWIFASTMVNIQFALAFGVLATGGPRSALTPLLAVPVLMVGARFSNHGLIVGAPLSAALALATTIGVDPGYALHHGETVIVPLALIASAALYISPLVASDVRHRTDSTLDELTGLLNRRALEPRFAEIAEQAALTDKPISVVAIDIDHFKAVNDCHGHAAGDLVLRAVADELRDRLRTFELLYRVGGEEFLLLLPGADDVDALRIAETLRAAVEELRPSGISVTCSFGVTTTPAGKDPFAALMRQADMALYAAKRNGRNRVEQHPRTLAARI